MHLIKSSPGLYTCQAWGLLVYIPEIFVILLNSLTKKADVRTREKS